MRDLRHHKFNRAREEFEIKQLAKLKDHPHVPADFNWQDYLFVNPFLAKKNIDTEFLAVRHWIKQGRRAGLRYKIDDVEADLVNAVHFPERKTLSKENWTSTSNHSIKRNKKVIYTCISGSYDTLKDVQNYDENWDYICFSNVYPPGVRGNWEVREIPRILDPLDQTRRARALKILPHLFLPDYEISIWIDGTIEIIQSPMKFVTSLIAPDDVFALSFHPDRTCVYQEKDACIRYGKDDQRILNEQAERYRKEGYPENWGMIQSMIIYRRNTKDVERLCNLWWEQVLTYSKRDQMSFNYVLWKFPIRIKTLSPSIVCSEFFWLYTHSSREAKKAKIRKDYSELKNFINGKPI